MTRNFGLSHKPYRYLALRFSASEMTRVVVYGGRIWINTLKIIRRLRKKCLTAVQAPWYACSLKPYDKTDAPVARGKISLTRGFHFRPNFCISFARPTSQYVLWSVCVYIYGYLTACRLYMNYRSYEITLQCNIFTQIWSGAKCWLDICHWVAGLAVSGRIRDIGQNVLQSAFQTGSSSNHSYSHVFFPYHIARWGLY